MVAHPGERYVYGINTDWLGKVVEAVAGKKLDAVIAEGIADPLGLTSTTFHPDDAQRDRAVMVHVKGERTASGALPGASSTQSPTGGRAGTAVLHAARLHRFRARTSPWRRARWAADPSGGDRRGGVPQPDRDDLDFPAEIPTAAPPITASFNAGPDHKWGYGLLLTPPTSPAGARPAPARGRAVQHPLLHRPRHGRVRLHLHQLPPLRDPGRLRHYVAFEEALYDAL